MYKKLLTIVSSLALLSTGVMATQLDQKSSKASMSVGVYADISDLNDFQLTTTGTDGAKNAFYSGNDDFRIKANAPINVIVSKEDLSNSAGTILSTTWKLDSDVNLSFDTSGVHNQVHNISAETTLGEVEEQEAGSYEADLTVTVSAI